MAIAKLLHEGESVRQLKNTIRYNTVAKEYLNSAENPRLLQAISNLGIIDISDPEVYQTFMTNFIDEILLNKSLSKNKRQTKLYAHEMLSFEHEDNLRFEQDELAQFSVEILSELYDMENTPYIIWPQTDSGHLHFHVVRSMYSNDGTYQRVKNSKLKMRKSCEIIEKRYNLTFTGNNVSGEIRSTYNSMLKVIKNYQLEAAFKHKKRISDAIALDSAITKVKRITYNLLMEDTYQSKAENTAHEEYEQAVQDITKKTTVNQNLESVKDRILTIYKNAKDENNFIDLIEQQNITIELLKHAKSGKNKGIAFHYQNEVISGGKISSSMTLGKIKKRFPNFIQTLESPPSIHSKENLQRKPLDFHIQQINKYYKQRNNKNNGDILIYFGKKNVEARPYNYNLKLSRNRDSIKFGPSTPNEHDLSLAIDVALKSGWKSATLKNSDNDFTVRLMKTACHRDRTLLFFVLPEKPHTLSYENLKTICSDLTANELKRALKLQLIKEDDLPSVYQDFAKTLKQNATSIDQRGFALAIEAGFSIECLDRKTAKELTNFYHHKTFHPVSKPIESKETLDITEDLKNIAEQLERLSTQYIISKNVSKSCKPTFGGNKIN